MASKMMMVEVKGTTPLLLHNGRSADVLDPLTKVFTGLLKKKAKDRTDEDLTTISSLEWWLGIYLDRQIVTDENYNCSCPVDSKLVLPTFMVEATIKNGAKKSRKGKLASAGCIVTKPSILTHRGPADVNQMFLDDRFHFRCMVVNPSTKTRTPKTRPIFNEWSTILEIMVDLEIINAEEVVDAIQDAGRFVGFGAWSPRTGGHHGMFSVGEYAVID